MGNCVHHVLKETPLPGGEKMVRGKINLSSSYAAAGDACNLSNYFQGSPQVVVQAMDQNSSNVAVGVSHNGGTAAAGLVRVYVGGTAEDEFLEANAALDFSGVNVPFVAIGQAY